MPQGPQLYPVVPGAAGKRFLATFSEIRLESILSKTEGFDRAVLGRELANARALGYSTSHGETVEAAAAIAVAIRRASGEVIGAINVTGPSNRLTPARLADLSAPVVEAGHEIMRQLGHVEPRRSEFF